MAALEGAAPADQQALSQVCGVLIRVVECDSASANKSMIATMTKSLPANTVMWTAYCLIHMLHITCGIALNIGGPRGNNSLPFVRALYCTAMLLRTPGYFLKVLDNVPPVARALAAAALLKRPGP